MHFNESEQKSFFPISKENKSTNRFVYFFHKKLLNTSYAPGTILGVGNTAMNKLAVNKLGKLMELHL